MNWIPVSDRNPPPQDVYCAVIVWVSDGEFEWTNIEIAMLIGDEWADDSDRVIDGITHYIPLPDVPKIWHKPSLKLPAESDDQNAKSA